MQALLLHFLSRLSRLSFFSFAARPKRRSLSLSVFPHSDAHALLLADTSIEIDWLSGGWIHFSCFIWAWGRAGHDCFPMTHVSPPSVGCGSKGWSCHRMQPRRYAFDFGLVSAVSMRADRLLLFFFDFSFFYFIFLSVLRPLLRCMVRRWLRIGSRRAALLLLRSQHFFNSRAVGDGAQDSSCCCCF